MVRNISDEQFCAEAYIKEVLESERGVPSLEVYVNQFERNEKRSGYSVTSAREWLEYIEQCDGPVGGVGAYTVLRCDAVYKGRKLSWRIWGLEFHMDRLCSSYGKLLGIHEARESDVHSTDSHSYFEESKLETDAVLAAMLEQAKRLLMPTGGTRERKPCNTADGRDLFRTLMVTILWTPSMKGCPEKGGLRKPFIRCHAAFAGLALAKTNGEDSDPPPTPITACLAIPNDATQKSWLMLPGRCSEHKIEHSHLAGASAKISSWCRARRPLEERFKMSDSKVGEVLLVKPVKKRPNNEQHCFVDSLEILEGLISNVFVVYKDGTVRTAPVCSVLSGYARQLVVDEFLLKLDESNAPTIQDAKAGLWSEVFVTSAIRLIVPVNRIIIPPVRGFESTTLWQYNGDGENPYALTMSIRSAIHRKGFTSATSIE